MVDRTEDSIAWALTVIVGIFVLGSLGALIVAAFMGQPGGEGVWSGLFAIITACLGALGGYLGGQQVERNRNGPKPPDA